MFGQEEGDIVQIAFRMGDMRVSTLNFVSLRMFDQKLHDFHLRGSRYSCTEEYLTYQVQHGFFPISRLQGDEARLWNFQVTQAKAKRNHSLIQIFVALIVS